MYELRVEGDFSASHQLRGYKGKCENLHGHNWHIEMYVRGDELNEIGILVDFKDLREILKKVLTILDHSFLNDIIPFNEINPSAENIAKFIFDKAKDYTDKLNIELYKIAVYETPKSMAVYIND